MKIALRGSASHRLCNKLEKAGATKLVGGIHGEMFFDATWPGSALEEFLRVASTHGAIDINPWMEFEDSELAQSRYLRVRPRKVISESNEDYKLMDDHVDSLSWRGEDKKRQYKLPDRMSLSKIRLKPNQVAVFGQWTAEYVVPQGVRHIFDDAGLSGIEFRPILQSRTGAAIEDFFHLYTSHCLGLRELDIASPEMESTLPEEQGYDALGCLCYDPAILAAAKDFNRTGEFMLGFRFPDWVVSTAVRDIFLENKLKGWAFEPVLELGTPLYEEYHALWASFYSLLADCKRHTVRYQSVG